METGLESASKQAAPLAASVKVSDAQAILDLTARVTALEAQLSALQRATAHITSIQPIKG
jgi:hypothetical protein